jgi:hypothetical protein
MLTCYASATHMKPFQIQTLAIIAVVGFSAMAFAQKKPKPVPETHPTEQTFHASCEAVWPMAVQALMAEGWGVKTSDRAGGILILEWTKGEWRGSSRFVNQQILQNTLEQATSFSHQWNTFRIISASVISAQEGTGCKYNISVVMQGDEVTKGWRVLQSNGFIENFLLGQIEGRLAK